MFGGIRRLKSGGAVALIVVLQLTLLTGRVLGQQQVTLRENPTGAWPWLVSLGVIVLVAGAAFMNAKRTHLD